ncbi:MAG: rhodanese-like domain-containing protein [Algoriphagus sp.]|nr:rhodanese-like domain-containing protein [Algoriphagus sp.]
MEIKNRFYCAFLALVLISPFLFFGEAKAQSTAYKTLLKGLYDEEFPIVKPGQISNLKNYQVLDTREKSEFEVSHLQGAKWVGYDTFSLENVEDLDKTQPVLVYCTVGARSQDIGKKLREAGFQRVYNLYGGIIHWSNENQLLFKDSLPTKQVHTYSRTWGVWLTSGEKVY